eukprot:199279-Chlamydomonas_euryale.AAC.1
MVLPPEPCPPDVRALLDDAAAAHNARNHESALAAYADARELWDELDPPPSRGGGGGGSSWDLARVAVGGGGVAEAGGGGGEAAPLQRHAVRDVYFALECGLVLVTAGRHADALAVAEGAAAAMVAPGSHGGHGGGDNGGGDSDGGGVSSGGGRGGDSPAHHALLASLHSLRGFCLNALGRHVLAHEHLVHAMVLRRRSLGVGHADMQLAAHNLGCVLDALGCCREAYELINAAHEVRDEGGRAIKVGGELRKL